MTVSLLRWDSALFLICLEGMAAGVVSSGWFLLGAKVLSFSFWHWVGEVVEDLAFHKWVADSLLLRCVSGELES